MEVTGSGDIVPPCGMGRELISDYAPNASVIIQRDNRLLAVPILDLLPDKYRSADFPNRRKQSNDARRA